MNQPAIRVLVVDDEAGHPQGAAASAGGARLSGRRGFARRRGAASCCAPASYDVVLLDINMPGIGGIETLRRIRAFAPRLPVLMLTVRDREEDKVEALELGADDYVTKPFSTRELIARIRTRGAPRARSRPAPKMRPSRLARFAWSRRSAASPSAAQPVHLTRKEFDILYCLMSRAGRVVTYAKLLTAVWGADCREEVEYLRTFVRQLRKKIEDDPSSPSTCSPMSMSATALPMRRCSRSETAAADVEATVRKTGSEQASSRVPGLV